MSNTSRVQVMKAPNLPPELADLADRIFHRAFDILFRAGVQRGYHGAALFLFLRHKGLLQLLPEERSFFGALAQLRHAVARSTGDTTVHEVFDALSEPLRDIGGHHLAELIHVFETIPEELLGMHYPALVDRLLHLIAKADGKYAGGYDQPIELTELILRLAEVPTGGSVYNPFAGLASLGALLRPDAQYYGQEVNARTWAMGMIRLWAHRPNSRNYLYQEDSIRSWNLPGEQFDLIVANPPFNLRVEDNRHYQTFRHTTAESIFLERGYGDANDKGKVICVVPIGFLFNNMGDRRRFRHWLVGSGTLDAVISLPGGLLSSTGIPMALIMLDKARDRYAPIRMMDASPFVMRVSRTERRIDVDALLDALNAREQPGVFRFVDESEVHANDLILSPKRYLLAPDEDVANGTRLGAFTTPIALERAEPGAKLPFVRIRDLKEDAMDPRLHVAALEVRDVPKHAKKLDRSALLVALRWSNLKPTWFEYTGTPVAVTNDVMVLEVDGEAVDVDFLAAELLSDHVKVQVERVNQGLTIPSLRRQDILDIRIELPSKPEQLAKMQGLRQAHVEALKRMADKEAERHGVELQRAGNTASLRHLLGTPLLNINSGVENIRVALDTLRPDWREHLISVREQMTLGDAIDNLVHELQRVATLLETDSTELQVERFPLESMDLLAYLKAVKRRVQLDLNGGHKVDLLVSSDVKEQLRGKVQVMGSKALLDMAIDALVDNARRHAFANEPEPHVLEFHLGLDLTHPKPFAMLSVINNGRPFPEGFDLDRYRTKNMFAGETGHTGLGGYHVNEIVQWHKGWLELRSGKEYVGPYSSAIELFIPLHQ